MGIIKDFKNSLSNGLIYSKLDTVINADVPESFKNLAIKIFSSVKVVDYKRYGVLGDIAKDISDIIPNNRCVDIDSIKNNKKRAVYDIDIDIPFTFDGNVLDGYYRDIFKTFERNNLKRSKKYYKIALGIKTYGYYYYKEDKTENNEKCYFIASIQDIGHYNPQTNSTDSEIVIELRCVYADQVSDELLMESTFNEGGYTMTKGNRYIHEGEIVKGDGQRYDSIFQNDRDNVASTFVTNKDMSPRDSGEVLYEYPEFNTIFGDRSEPETSVEKVGIKEDKQVLDPLCDRDHEYEDKKDGMRYDSIFQGDRDNVEYSFVTNNDLTPKKSDEVFYHYPEFNKGINEHMDLTDKTTRKILLSMNEVGQSTLLTSLTSKLYDNIVKKVDDIDYGNIPNTKGDITKLENYDQIIDCIELMRGILNEYNQDTKPIDEIALAVSNVSSRKDLFERGYRYKAELVMIMYCNIVLAIIGSISYMIATSVEFIKTPNQDNFEITLDKVGYAKSKDYVLYDSIRKFNSSCKDESLDKAMENVLKNRVHREAASVAAAGSAAVIALGALLLVIIPILREIVFLFYYTRMKISDFFDIQADLLQMNAYNIQSNGATTVGKDSGKVVTRQLKIVEKFRKLSNFFAIKFKKAEVDSEREYKSNDRKYKIDEVIDEIPGDTSALF